MVAVRTVRPTCQHSTISCLLNKTARGSSPSGRLTAAVAQTKNFFDADLVARISRLELTARRIVDGFLAGKNRSSRHGFSVEFVEHREYAPGTT